MRKPTQPNRLSMDLIAYHFLHCTLYTPCFFTSELFHCSIEYITQHEKKEHLNTFDSVSWWYDKAGTPNVPLTQICHHHFKCISKINTYVTYVKEAILEPLPRKTLTLHNFCIRYPNVAFFGNHVENQRI